MKSPAWKSVPCPTCKKVAGIGCVSVTVHGWGHQKSRPHAARVRASAPVAPKEKP